MASLSLACMSATTFDKSGDFDEEAMRQYLQRFIDQKIAIYLASGGSGEGHALKPEELRRLYRTGVVACRGKVPVCANPPEQYTARATLEQVLLAVDCGVDIVNIYGPAGWHAYKPTNEEYTGFFDTILPAIKHPVAVAPNPTQGYLPAPSVVADVCNRHANVHAINLPNSEEGYFVDLKRALVRDIPIHVQVKGSMNCFSLGAAGIIGTEANLVPRTFRRYVDLVQAGNIEESGTAFSDLIRVAAYARRWANINARAIKMFMRVLKLPGWEGGLREPCRLPSATVMECFAEGLTKLRIAEIDDLARAAGVPVPI